MLIMERLVKGVRDAAIHNPDVQAAPRCILWPDGDRQWEAVAARLQAELPEMFILGEYDVGKKTGPAIWLRCVLVGKAPNIATPSGSTPILYLPGVSRQDLRAVETCPDHLKPLAELQYSGVIWSQINGKDWTILAFLKSHEGGLGLDVSQDNDSKHAMQLALYRLLDEDIDLLKGKRLDKDYFNTLLTGGDPVRDLLQWLDQGEAFRAARDENSWTGFVEVCKSRLAFDPANYGNLKGAMFLAERKGPWLPVWERFCEAPNRYPNIPSLIRQVPLQIDFCSNAHTHGAWPQWNDRQEQTLRTELLDIQRFPPHDARRRLEELERRHKERRDLVWAELGDAPLACALEHLARLAEVTNNALTAGTIKDLQEAYLSSGWRADNAVLRALACVIRQEDLDAVSVAIRAIYLPWAEDAARYLQKVVARQGYPRQRDAKAAPGPGKPGQCVVFVDGLRFDVARRLSHRLNAKGLTVVEESLIWAALPSVTATGKPAVSPVSHLIVGQEANADFEPCVAATSQSLKGGYHFRKLLSQEGWRLPDKSTEQDLQGPVWCEVGNIDHEGHEKGWKLAGRLDTILDEVVDRIARLLAAGFNRIRVVTDHGWIVMPGGLPKTELPSSLIENAWGRCAALKPGASTKERLFPWFWNAYQEFALADGISCYRAGMEYAHGGLSLQECLTLQLVVSAGEEAVLGSPIRITDVHWKNMRCKVAAEGKTIGLSIDVRMQPGNPATSVATAPKPFKDDGTGSVLVEDRDLEGQEAMVVLLDDEGRLIAQRSTHIGKEDD